MSSATVQTAASNVCPKPKATQNRSAFLGERRMSAEASGMVIMPTPKLRILKGPMSMLAACM